MSTIVQVGTFEVDNYGDLMFPIVFEKELSSRIGSFDHKLYSPLSSNSKPKPIASLSTQDTESFEYKDVSLKAIVIGGGDLISFNSKIASVYEQHWTSSMSAHTACWAIPGIKRASGVPLIWNSPGVPYPFTPQQATLVRELCKEVDYLSVRDEISRTRLIEAGVNPNTIELVPDSVLKLPEHFPAESLKSKAEGVYKQFGLKLGEPLIIQLLPNISDLQIPNLMKNIQELKQLLKLPILLLPIGYCHDDSRILKKLHLASQGEFHFVEDRLDIFEIAAVIAHSGCFVGNSLHGNITAYAYGVPHLMVNNVLLSKLKGFADIIQEPERCIAKFEELGKKYQLLQKMPSRKIYQGLKEQIDLSFDQIAKVIKVKSPFISDQLTREKLFKILQDVVEKDFAKKKLLVQLKIPQIRKFLRKRINSIVYSNVFQNISVGVKELKKRIVG